MALNFVDSNLVADDTNGDYDTFAHDRNAAATERVSVDSSEVQGDDISFDPVITPDGRIVAFGSYRSNLVPADTDGERDVFVRVRDASADSTKVEVRDAVIGELFNNLWFAPSFEPRQVITLPDLNGNGSAEVGVVLTKADEPDWVAIKDTLTGERVGTLMAWQPQQGFDLPQALPVPDADGNATHKVRCCCMSRPPARPWCGLPMPPPMCS